MRLLITVCTQILYKHSNVDATSSFYFINLNILKPTFNILISFPSKFCDLARFFFVMLLMATTKFGFYKTKYVRWIYKYCLINYKL